LLQQAFEDRIAATAIVNQAALKCLVFGVRVTPDNVLRMIGDFTDPTKPELVPLIDAILQAVDEVTLVPTLRPNLDN
jgi:hypothetical protein